MLDTEFSKLSKKLLEDIFNIIEDQDIQGLIDLELNDGVLKISVNDEIFIINKNSINKEIWLSSPISGPYHFALREEKWLTRTDKELFTILEQELSVKFI